MGVGARARRGRRECPLGKGRPPPPLSAPPAALSPPARPRRAIEPGPACLATVRGPGGGATARAAVNTAPRQRGIGCTLDSTALTRSPPHPTPHTQPPYKILPNADAVRARAAAAVAEVTAVLSVPDADAVRVLRHFKW